MKDKKIRFDFRKERTRRALAQFASDRPRLSVHRSLRHIYAQVIDDSKGVTVAAVSSLSKEIHQKFPKSAKNKEAAQAVGALIAKKAVEAGVKKVAFDRGGHVYHGRLKALADSARSSGLEF